MPVVLGIVGFVLFLLLVALLTGVRIVDQYDRLVVYRLGKVLPNPLGPGLVLLLPFGIDKPVRVSVQQKVQQIAAQKVITKDNVSVQVDAITYVEVVDPVKSQVEVQFFESAAQMASETSLREIIGRHELDQLLSSRETVNTELTVALDAKTERWGVKVERVEIRDVVLPEQMQRAMAKQAEAERERRAKIIAAEGELQASVQLSEAARTMAASPGSIQLRQLQTMAEIATEKNSTIIFPIPTELLNLAAVATEVLNRAPQ